MIDAPMNRRSFIASSAVLGLGVLSGCAASQAAARALPYKSASGLGVQLYTLRSLFKEDYRTTLDFVAALGLKDCEFAGYFEHNPSEVKKHMDGLGLVSNCAHIKIDQLKLEMPKMLEIASIMGQSQLIIPWMPEEMRTLDGYKSLAELLNRQGEMASSYGISVAYHNHSFEFDSLGEETGYDILLRETQPGLVNFEIDLFWTHQANVSAKSLFEQAPGRFVACHIKDASPSGEMVPVGDGIIDFAAIFEDCELAGMKYFYIEHDKPADPMDSVKRSAQHLLSLEAIV